MGALILAEHPRHQGDDHRSLADAMADDYRHLLRRPGQYGCALALDQRDLERYGLALLTAFGAPAIGNDGFARGHQAEERRGQLSGGLDVDDERAALLDVFFEQCRPSSAQFDVA